MTAGTASFTSFVATRLGRRLLTLMAVVLTVCSLLFLSVFTGAYRQKLIADHAAASEQVNRVLATAIFQGHTRHDAQGLSALVAALAGGKDIAGIHVLDAQGQWRFGDPPDGAVAAPGDATPFRGTDMTWQLLRGAKRGDVLRTVNPIAGQPGCEACHAGVATQARIGSLIVDYAAGDIGRETMWGALFMTLAGGFVLLSSLTALSYYLHRTVNAPIGRLNAATMAISEGHLEARVTPDGTDEIADLGHRFNEMAARIGESVDRLQQSESFLQRVIDAVPDGVRVIGQDFRILRVNDAYCRQLGVAAAQAVNRPCHVSSHHAQEPCAPGLVTCPLVELSEDGRQSLKCRQRHLRADGSEFFVEVSAARARLVHDGVETPCIVESIRDLSQQSQSSHQDRLAEIGQLAAGVAHEIHNPLWSIHLALEQARVAGDGETLGTYIDIAAREIDRCLMVTDRLLKLSAPAGEDPKLIEIAPLIADVAGLISVEAQQRGVAIAINIDGRPRVIANESDLGIVVLNICQNAIHAMPAGGTLTVRGAIKGGGIELSFADTGVGIAPENITRIFWPFWSHRADGSEGSGLGLSICKTIIDRMRGTIAVSSTRGVGSTFTITLPNPDEDSGNEGTSHD